MLIARVQWVLVQVEIWNNLRTVTRSDARLSRSDAKNVEKQTDSHFGILSHMFFQQGTMGPHKGICIFWTAFRRGRPEQSCGFGLWLGISSSGASY